MWLDLFVVSLILNFQRCRYFLVERMSDSQFLHYSRLGVLPKYWYRHHVIANAVQIKDSGPGLLWHMNYSSTVTVVLWPDMIQDNRKGKGTIHSMQVAIHENHSSTSTHLMNFSTIVMTVIFTTSTLACQSFKHCCIQASLRQPPITGAPLAALGDRVAHLLQLFPVEKRSSHTQMGCCAGSKCNEIIVPCVKTHSHGGRKLKKAPVQGARVPRHIGGQSSW